MQKLEVLSGARVEYYLLEKHGNLQQGSKFASTCSISHTLIQTQNPGSRFFGLCFGLELWVSCVED